MGKIWLDCDGVLADFVAAYLQLVERLHGRKLTHANVTDFHFSKCIVSAEEDARVWQEIDRSPGLVVQLDDLPGVAALDELRTLGTVGCLTSPHLGPTWIPERAAWLMRRGFTKREIIFASNKTHVAGDVLVDDSKDNCEAWQDAHPRGVAILLDQPWNQGSASVLRAHNWDEVLYAVRSTLSRVQVA